MAKPKILLIGEHHPTHVISIEEDDKGNICAYRGAFEKVLEQLDIQVRWIKDFLNENQGKKIKLFFEYPPKTDMMIRAGEMLRTAKDEKKDKVLKEFNKMIKQDEWAVYKAWIASKSLEKYRELEKMLDNVKEYIRLFLNFKKGKKPFSWRPPRLSKGVENVLYNVLDRGPDRIIFEHMKKWENAYGLSDAAQGILKIRLAKAMVFLNPEVIVGMTEKEKKQTTGAYIIKETGIYNVYFIDSVDLMLEEVFRENVQVDAGGNELLQSLYRALEVNGFAEHRSFGSSIKSAAQRLAKACKEAGNDKEKEVGKKAYELANKIAETLKWLKDEVENREHKRVIIRKQRSNFMLDEIKENLKQDEIGIAIMGDGHAKHIKTELEKTVSVKYEVSKHIIRTKIEVEFLELVNKIRKIIEKTPPYRLDDIDTQVELNRIIAKELKKNPKLGKVLGSLKKNR